MLVRALIVLFSVLNLGAAAWWIAHDPPPPPAPARAPAGVAQLKLVHEQGAPAAIPAVPAPVPEAPPPAELRADTPPVASLCFSFGPFATRREAAAAAGRLRPLVQDIRTREQPAAAVPARAWRVYLPPLPSPEQARAVAERIGAAGFDDYLVVREGAEANSIALGRYRSAAAANRRASALIAAGFAVQTEPLGAAAETAAPVWLDVSAADGFDAGGAQAAIGAARQRSIECPSR